MVELLYDSRTDSPGVGYPSCSRELATIPPNVNDVNGYYFDLELHPWASIAEIRRAVRRKLKRHHPDGMAPDPLKYRRYLIIRDVLLTPSRKVLYDSTRESELFIDEQMREQLLDSGVPAKALTDLEPTTPPAKSEHWDYFAFGQHPMDAEWARAWYESLVAVAPMFGYRRPIRVLLHDADPQWKERGGILLIPRAWMPSTATAFALFSCLVSNDTPVARRV